MATNADTILTINDLNAVIDALWDARPKWKDIGRCIGVDAGTLATMKGSDNDCLRDTLTHWLRGVYKPGEPNSKPRTWHTLIEALRAKAVNEEAMAKELKKLDTIQGPPSTGDSNGVPKEETPLTVTNQAAPASKKTLSFSDNLPPHDLVEWLTQELEKKGLPLNQQLKDKLVDEEINGAALKNLSDEALTNMGFKTGLRMNIMTIMKTCTVTLEEKGNERMKLTDAEKRARVEHDDKTEYDVPHVLCTMELTPKMDSPPAASTADPGFVPAALPYESRLWRKKELKVQIKKQHLLSRWGVKLTKFMECANRWSSGTVSVGSNHIPKFKEGDRDPDIVVELNEDGCNQSTIGCVEGQGPTQVYLDLSYPDKNYREHLIVHEFGHALGLGHEHQRSDFWSWIKDYVDENKMKQDVGGRLAHWQPQYGLTDGGATPYDSSSVMHYWFKKSWLKNDYSNKEYLDKKSKFLSEGLKQALYGVHERDGKVVTKPSVDDLDFLSAKYEEVLPDESTKEEEIGSSRIFADGEEFTTPDHVNGTTAHGPPQPDFSGLKEVSTGLLEEITWDGDKKELCVYAKTAKEWIPIARKLGLEEKEPGCIDEIAKTRSNNNIECVREVFGKWLKNAVGLPNARQFPKSWEGLLKLLTKSQLGEVAKELHIALAAPDSSARRK